jgi:hypothetical protein
MVPITLTAEYGVSHKLVDHCTSIVDAHPLARVFWTRYLILATTMLKTILLLYTSTKEDYAMVDAQKACDLMFGSLAVHTIIILCLTLPMISAVDGWRDFAMEISGFAIVLFIVLLGKRFSKPAVLDLELGPK